MFSIQQHLMKTLRKLTNNTTTAATGSLATTATTVPTISNEANPTSQTAADGSNCECCFKTNGIVYSKVNASNTAHLANRSVKTNRSLKCDVTLTRKLRAIATETTTTALVNEAGEVRNCANYLPLASTLQQHLPWLTFTEHNNSVNSCYGDNSCSRDNSCSHQKAKMYENNNDSSQIVLYKQNSANPLINCKNVENRAECFRICANSELVDCKHCGVVDIRSVKRESNISSAIINKIFDRQQAINNSIYHRRHQHPAFIPNSQQQQQQVVYFHTEKQRQLQSKQNHQSPKQSISMSSLAVKSSAVQQATDDGFNKQVLFSDKELPTTATVTSPSTSTSPSSSAETFRKLSTNASGTEATSTCSEARAVHSSSAKKPCFNTSLTDILQFMEIIGNLKHTKRTGWVLRDINDCESISGHMYRMSILTFLLDGSEGVNQIRCMELALVHDLAESLVGDITPFCGVSKNEKRAMEFKAMEDICKLIEPRGKRIMELFEEYENGESAESKFVKDLDRLDMIMQAFEYEKRDNCLLKHQEFFDSTEGKFHHPFIKKLVNEIYEQRNKLAQDTGVQLQHKPSLSNINSRFTSNATADNCCTSPETATATSSKSSRSTKPSSPSTT